MQPDRHIEGVCVFDRNVRGKLVNKRKQQTRNKKQKKREE